MLAVDQHGQHQAKKHECGTKINRSLFQHVRRAGPKSLVRNGRAEGRAQPLLLGSLHKYHAQKKKGDNNQNGKKQLNADIE